MCARRTDESLRASAPDRRTFSLECADGLVRAIRGYLGSLGPRAHRAPPVEDARLLVNLVAAPDTRLPLDPFAGAGGVVIARKLAASLPSASTSTQPCASDSRNSPTGTLLVMRHPCRLAPRPSIWWQPKHPTMTSALAVLLASIDEIARVLRAGGCAAFLLASEQAAEVQKAGAGTGLVQENESTANRKSVSATCQCWSRPRSLRHSLNKRAALVEFEELRSSTWATPDVCRCW